MKYILSAFFSPVHAHPHPVSRIGAFKTGEAHYPFERWLCALGSQKVFSFCQVVCTVGCSSPPARKLRIFLGECWSSTGSLSKQIDEVVGEDAGNVLVSKWAALLLLNPGT